MCNNASWYFHLSARRQVARRGLQEEEGLLGDSVIELLDVVCIVTTNRYDL